MHSDDAAAEQALIADADARARKWLEGTGTRRVFPDSGAIDAVHGLAARLSDEGRPAVETLRLLDEVGGRATVASNDPRYFGFVVGASLPIAAAAERIMLAWDQCASSFENSPVADILERQAAALLLEALDLPRDAAVGFSTSATAGTLSVLATARRVLLGRQGWDFDRRGMHGAPQIRIVASERTHITVLKALRVLGFGTDSIDLAETDSLGRIRPSALPPLDSRTILLLQAGDVATGEFDSFAELIPPAREVGAWTHVDGAFGLWARASRSHRHLTAGVEEADSWTTDGHKWLNTPYDSAMHIVRDASALSAAMTANASYSAGDDDAQKNLTLEFSRRARGIPVWAVLRTLGRRGLEALVDNGVRLAQRAATGLRDSGLTVDNRVVLNQVLVRASTPQETVSLRERVLESGHAWVGQAVSAGEPAIRISVSSWRTKDSDIDALVALISTAHSDLSPSDIL